MEDNKELFDDLSAIAKNYGRSKIKDKENAKKLRTIGFKPKELTNNALIVASVFSNAVNGDMKAVEKWQELTNSEEEKEGNLDEISSIIADRSDGEPGAFRKDRS